MIIYIDFTVLKHNSIYRVFSCFIKCLILETTGCDGLTTMTYRDEAYGQMFEYLMDFLGGFKWECLFSFNLVFDKECMELSIIYLYY